MKWLILLAALFFAGPAAAAICTDGTDCYCDCVNGPVDGGGVYKNSSCEDRDVPVDTSVLLCEDFEAITLVAGNGTGTLGQTGPGSGATACTPGNPNANCYGNTSAPLYGPHYDPTGSPSGANDRGYNGYWNRTYGTPSGACGFSSGWPTAPTLGTPCGFGTCNGHGVHTSVAANNPDPLFTCLAFYRAGEFDTERGSLADPTLPDGGSGPFDGTTSLAQRNPVSNLQGAGTGGFHGGKNFGRNVTHLGITQAFAFPADISGSRILNSPWKINEQGWHGSNNFENIETANTAPGAGASTIPLAPFAFGTGGGSVPCNTALNNATVTVGHAQCSLNDGNLGVYPDAAQYNQPVDFPFGSWGCIRAEQKDKGTDHMEWRLWFNDVLVFEMTGFDSTILLFDSFDKYKWNNHANHNQFFGQSTAYTTYRYMDNVHVREGEPVTCEQIGLNLDGEPEPSAGTLALSAATYTVAEGDANLVVTVARTGGTDGAVTAEISTAQTGVAEVYEDWTPDPVQVSFGNGVGGTTTANIPITADVLDEDAETFTISLGSPTGGATIGAIDDAVVTITDDDDTPTLSISDATAAESNNGAFIVTLSAESGRTVTVNVNSSNGTAIGTVDFTPVVASTLTYTPGQTSKAATVTVTNDALDENSETYTMTLSGASNATLEDATGAGVITDNDSPPTVTLAANPLVMAEAGGTSTVYAELSAPSGLDVTVPLIFDGSSATLTTDYTRSGTSISIPGNVGNTVGSITLTAVQDVALETGELVRVRVSPDPTNATLSGEGDVTVDITDDDILPPPIEPYSTPVLLNAN